MLDAEPAAAQLAQQTMVAHKQGMLSNSISLKIFRYLRPVKPSPRRHMLADGRVLSEVESNQAWLAKVKSQCCEGAALCEHL